MPKLGQGGNSEISARRNRSASLQVSEHASPCTISERPRRSCARTCSRRLVLSVAPERPPAVGPEQRGALEHRRCPGTRHHPPRTHARVQRQHAPAHVHAGDVQRVAHEARMDRPARGERHDQRQAAPPHRVPHRHAEQSWRESSRHHQLRRPPAQLIERALERFTAFLASHRYITTPGRHGSMTTARSCSRYSGAPMSTPAIVSADGQGA